MLRTVTAALVFTGRPTGPFRGPRSRPFTRRFLLLLFLSLPLSFSHSLFLSPSPLLYLQHQSLIIKLYSSPNRLFFLTHSLSLSLSTFYYLPILVLSRYTLYEP
uniref:Uncharacterized protein n=1 Tax=Cacopsylla melanoneura TaxID=428564 RepID=A0A8D8TE54_9HEMI